MAWLLARRGYTPVVLERKDRIGGKIWTLPPGEDGVIRELGAAFLSPDYYETRALMHRFGVDEVPVSLSNGVRFHPEANPTGPGILGSTWYADRLQVPVPERVHRLY